MDRVISWSMFAGVFAVTFYFLKEVYEPSDYVITISVAVIAWLVADGISHVIACLVPKTKIDPTGKAVFITGCDSGFGHELAKSLDSLGFHVYAGCLFPTGENAENLKKSCSERLKVIQIDVTNDEQVKAAAEDVANSLDGKELWSIVNNAGIAVYAEVEWCSFEMFQKILDVNTLGIVRVTKAFLPLLKESQGRVVIVASLAGRFTAPGLTAYSMSKHAAVSFADGLRREMKKWNVSVHTIEPIFYRTPITDVERTRNDSQKAWEATPLEIRQSYGEEYFKQFKERIAWNDTIMTRNNIHEVIDDLVDAVAAKRTKIRYVPSIIVRIQMKINELLIPCPIQDYIYGYCMPRVCPAKKCGKS